MFDQKHWISDKLKSLRLALRALFIIGSIFCVMGLLLEFFSCIGFKRFYFTTGYPWILIGYYIAKQPSRSIAFLAMLYSLVGIVAPFVRIIEQPFSLWQVQFSIILFFLSYYAFRLTITYHRVIESKVVWKNVFKKIFVAAIYTYFAMRILRTLISFMEIQYEKESINLLIGAVMLATIFTFKGWLGFSSREQPLLSIPKKDDLIA